MVVLAFGRRSFAAHGFSFCIIGGENRHWFDLMKEWQEKRDFLVFVQAAQVRQFRNIKVCVTTNVEQKG